MKLLILNGPNINFLGIREPAIYGHETYADLLDRISAYGEKIGVEVSFVQSNHEGVLIDEIQKAYYGQVDGIVFNPAGYTHTSIALADAIKGVGIPTVEVHISAVNERESYRQISYIRSVALTCISGKGFAGYLEAMDILKKHIESQHEN